VTTSARLLCPVPVPTLSVFYHPVLKVLGRRTNFEPYVLVKLDDALRGEILREAGFDPDNLPEEWVRTRRQKPKGLDRSIGEAYRFQNLDKSYARKMRAKQGARTIPSDHPQGRRGWWGLTEEGVKQAKFLSQEPKKERKKPNATSLWLTKHLTPKPGQPESRLMAMMKAAVAKKCPISASMDQIEDHVQQCFLRLIRRDALRKRIEQGQKISYTHIATYAVRSAYTDVRDAGTEPVTREMLGARTEKERSRYKEGSPPQMGILTPGIEMSEGHELLDVHDDTTNPAEFLTERLSFERLWTRLEDAMRASKPHAYERYVGLLRMQILDGCSVKEIAEKEGVSPHRAATMLQEARRAIRQVGRDAFV